MALAYQELLASPRIPHTCRLIPTRRRQPHSIRAERYAANDVGMALAFQELLASPRIPHTRPSDRHSP